MFALRQIISSISAVSDGGKSSLFIRFELFSDFFPFFLIFSSFYHLKKAEMRVFSVNGYSNLRTGRPSGPASIPARTAEKRNLRT